VADNACCTD